MILLTILPSIIINYRIPWAVFERGKRNGGRGGRWVRKEKK